MAPLPKPPKKPKPRNDEKLRPKHVGMPYLKDIRYIRKKRERKMSMKDLFVCSDGTKLEPLTKCRKKPRTEEIHPFRPRFS